PARRDRFLDWYGPHVRQPPFPPRRSSDLQNLTLLLGHPIFTLAVLLFTLLAAGGFGSAVSAFVPPRGACLVIAALGTNERADGADRKSTRLNSSHVKISYAVFCLKKKTQL